MNRKIAVIILSLLFGIIPYDVCVGQSDIEIAKQFISDLPPACKSSRYSVSNDGTVIIWILCAGPTPDKSVDGEVHIKNGLVKKVR